MRVFRGPDGERLEFFERKEAQLGLLSWFLGVCLLIHFLAQYHTIVLGLMASIAAGLATGVGALPIFFTRSVSPKVLDTMLGFAAGVMLAATAFSLVVPAIEYGGGGTTGAAWAALGIMIGGVFLDLVDKRFPHLHPVAGREGASSDLRRAWLFVIAVAIHNFPEGLAVGVGFGHGDVANGVSLAIGIALQNMPEGLAVALPLVREGYSPRRAFLIALLSGLVEPLGGLIGVGLAQLARPILPLGMAFAAGAMLFVISDEIIPETHRRGFQRTATYALLAGFVVMMFLDVALG